MGRRRLDPDRLKVAPLNLPRGWPGPTRPWEIERGFRLRVVSPEVLVIHLGAAAEGARPGPGPGEEALVLVLAPEDPRAEVVAAAAGLPRAEGWEAGALLVLSDDRRLDRPFGRLRRELKGAAAGLAAFWVLQEMPYDYFTAEHTLRQLGRVGRRAARWARWRRWLPR